MLVTLARIVTTAILGVVIGFFVAVSGFADGAPRERAIVIAVILLAYGIVGLGLGFRASVWYGLGLAIPGVVVLLLHVGIDDGSRWYLLYAMLIVAVAMAGAYGGHRLGMRRPASGATLGVP